MDLASSLRICMPLTSCHDRELSFSSLLATTGRLYRAYPGTATQPFLTRRSHNDNHDNLPADGVRRPLIECDLHGFSDTSLRPSSESSACTGGTVTASSVASIIMPVAAAWEFADTRVRLFEDVRSLYRDWPASIRLHPTRSRTSGMGGRTKGPCEHAKSQKAPIAAWDLTS